MAGGSAEATSVTPMCGKCRKATPSLTCSDCELAYCNACAEKRHTKGAFKRHTLVPLVQCDECDERAAAISCSECELNFCARCCAEVHGIGSMREHESNGAFKPINGFDAAEPEHGSPESVIDTSASGDTEPVGSSSPPAAAAPVTGSAPTETPPSDSTADVLAAPVVLLDTAGLPEVSLDRLDRLERTDSSSSEPPLAPSRAKLAADADSFSPAGKPVPARGVALMATGSQDDWGMSIGESKGGGDWESALGNNLAAAIDASPDDPKYRTWSGWELFRNGEPKPASTASKATAPVPWSNHLQLVGGVQQQPPAGPKYQTIGHLPRFAAPPPPGFGYGATQQSRFTPPFVRVTPEPGPAFSFGAGHARAHMSPLQQQMLMAEQRRHNPYHGTDPSPRASDRSPRGSDRSPRGSDPSPRNRKGKGSRGRQVPLDINEVVSGRDRRTTLMIRNIPNKYTQQMLLAEINETHAGLYDFFYLPIDFKNRCNVGYAFINLMDFASIIPLYEKFNGKKWRRFASEKICVLSYGRIQGKESLITRFQNSSLLDKDDDCRPLLFHSEGPLKGQRLEFRPTRRGRREGRGGRSRERDRAPPAPAPVMQAGYPPMAPVYVPQMGGMSPMSQVRPPSASVPISLMPPGSALAPPYQPGQH